MRRVGRLPESRKLMQPRETLGMAFGLAGSAIFAATLPMTRLAVGDLGPWFLTAARAAGAGLIAAAVLAVLRRPLPPPRRLAQLALVALLLVGGFPGASSLAMQTASAAHAGVIIGILPLATAVLGALFAGERPSSGFWISAAAGAATVVAFALRRGGGAPTPGDLFLVAAVASAAVGYVISGRLARIMPGWEVISWAVVLALPVTAPATLLLWPAAGRTVAPASWAGLTYLAVMSMYVGYFAWNAGMAIGGFARVSQVQLLQPFMTLLIAALLLGERIDAETVLFALAVAALVLLGRMFRVQRSPQTGVADGREGTSAGVPGVRP